MFKKVVREELRVPATFDSLKALRDFVTKIGKKYRFSEKVINAFKLAVDEASTNIIRHSYRDRTGDITIRAIIRKNSFTISLVDQGRYFDPTGVKDPDLKRYVAIGKKGGLGIFMIRRLVDEISYNRTDEGNELRLTKTKDIERKSLFSLPSVPGSMRVKYYSVSAAVVSFIVLLGYLYNFSTADNKIMAVANDRMRAISRLFAQNCVKPLADGDFLELSKAATIIRKEDSSYVYAAVVTDSNSIIQGSTDPIRFPVFEKYRKPPTIKKISSDIVLASIVQDSKNKESEKYFIIQRPVISSFSGEESFLGNTYLFVPANPIFHSISTKRWNDFQVALLVLVLGNLGIGLLLFLIFTPLQKLSNWIKDMGQADIRDQIDIDTSNEIGQIAQAFGEITDKFRESQKSLAEQQRIQQEMHLAKEIQQTLLPTEFPEIAGYEIASYYESAKEVGGDYYDFVEVDKDRLGIVVADVSGKGVPGSLVMTMIRTALRTEARGETSAAQVLAKVNDFVLDDIRKGMFVTLFYAILDSRRRRITFASAGHNPMILYRASTGKTYYLNPKGFPVGISLHEKDLFRKAIEDDTIQLTKGDIVLCYTDGITEAMNSKRDLFGEERLLDVIRKYGNLRAKQFAEKLKEELVSFTEGQMQYDDITFVVIKEKMSAEEAEFERAREIYYDMIQNNISMTEACLKHGFPVSTFSQKYRAKFEELGDSFQKEFESTSVEAKHLSIEEQTKIYDIIRKHPEWGAQRISEALNTAEYNFTVIPEHRIYNELVRKRLNTRSLREAYIARSANKKRMKPPGTPLLTLDGKIILQDELEPKLSAPVPEEHPPSPEDSKEPLAPPVPPSKKEEEKESTVDVEDESDLFLTDLDELLDKRKAVPEDKPQEKDLALPERETELPSFDESTPADDEVSKDVEQILNEIPIDSGDEEPKEEIDFQDLPLSEYAEELFENRSNGDEEQKEPETELTQEETETEDKETSGEELIQDISNGIDESEVEEGGSSDDFDVLIESMIDDISEVDKSIIKKDAGSIEKQQNSHLKSDDRSQKGKVDADLEQEPSPEELLSSISAEILAERNDFDKETPDPSNDTVESLFDLVAEDDISLDMELVHSVQEPGISQNKKASSRTGGKNNQEKWLLAGAHYYMQKKYDKAIEIFERVLQKYPDNVEAYYNLGNSYFRLKRLDEAQNAYEKACQLDPTYLDAFENLGVIFANKKQYKDAIRVWKKVLEFDPKREDIRKYIEKASKLARNRS